MARRLPVLALVVVVGVLGFTLPAVAKSSHATRHTRLVLTVRRSGRLFARGRAHFVTPSPLPPAVVAYTGFPCEVTVGVGSDDQTPQNHIVTDSTEFYIAYSPGLYSVTTTCVGKLPRSTTISKKVVSHKVACRQFNPFNQSAATIQGFGTSTTYPSGFFSESCNTPNFSPPPKP